MKNFQKELSNFKFKSKLNYSVDKVILKKGTIVHINGFPVELSEDTKVLGFLENLENNNIGITGQFEKIKNGPDEN